MARNLSAHHAAAIRPGAHRSTAKRIAIPAAVPSPIGIPAMHGSGIPNGVRSEKQVVPVELVDVVDELPADIVQPAVVGGYPAAPT